VSKQLLSNARFFLTSSKSNFSNQKKRMKMKRLFTVFFAVMFFAAGLNAQQNHLRWAATGGGTAADFGEGVTTDDEGNAYITGYFRYGMDFLDQEILPEGEMNSMFMIKVSPEQELLWYVLGEADGATGAGGFKTYYKNGFVYLLGDFRGAATFSSTDFSDISISSETRALFVAKYTTNGVLEWVRKMESSHTAGLILTGSANNLAVDEAGAVYVSTQFRTDLDVAGTLIDPDGSGGTNFHAVLVKLDALGAYQWHWKTTHTGDDRGEALTILPNGNVAFAIRYNSSVTINDVLYENASGGQAIIELNAAGLHQWHHTYTTANINQSYIWSLEGDTQGNLYVGGAHRTTLQWDDDTSFVEENSTRMTAFVWKLDADRDIDWTLFYGDPGENTHVRSLVLSAEGNLYVAGDHIGTMQLNDDLTLVSNDGSNDTYFLVIDPEDGSVLTGNVFGGTSNEILGAMAVSPLNDIYFIGRFLNVFEANGETFDSAGSWDFYLVKLGDWNTDATLANIKVDDVELEGFDPEVLEYEVVLPADAQDVPVVSAVANDELAEVVIVQATSLTGEEEARTATITVTAEDPEVELVYTVTFRLKSTDATLAAIMLDGVPLDVFSPEVSTYLIMLPNSVVDFPEVTATAADENATVDVGDLTVHPDVDNLWTVEILVTAEDPEYTQTYTVEFSYLDDEDALEEITLDGDPLEGFDPEVLNYEVTLPVGTTVAPEVDATPLSPHATVSITQATDLSGDAAERTATITVTAQDPDFTRTYTIVFDVDATNVTIPAGLQLSVYPNPASSYLRVDGISSAIALMVFDATGNEVMHVDAPGENVSLQVSQLRNGIYFLRVILENGAMETRRFVISK
jgi:hypothetical protein